MLRGSTGTFTSLANPRFRLLWIGTLCNSAGIWTSNTTRGFLVFQLTESGAALAAVFLAIGITMVGLSPFAGAWVDRLAPKRIVLIAWTAFVISSAVTALLVGTGVVELWMVLLLATADGAGNALSGAGRQALVGRIVDRATLGNASGLQQVAFNSSKVVAPVVAGVLIDTGGIGLTGAFLFQAALFATAVAAILGLSGIAPVPAAAARSFWREIAAGVQYVRGRPSLTVLVLMSLAMSLTAFPYFVFLPAIVEDLFDRGAVGLGVMGTVGASGGFLAALGIAAVADRPVAWRVFFAINLSFGALVLVLAAMPGFAVALPVILALGVCEGGVIAMGQSLALKYGDPAYHGRLQSMMILTLGLTGFAALPMGALGDDIGLRAQLTIMGAVGAAASIGVLLLASRIGAAADARAASAAPASALTTQPTTPSPGA